MRTNYQIVFNKGKNLGSFEIRGEYIHVFVKSPNKESQNRKLAIKSGIKYFDKSHARYTALMIASRKLNKAIAGENITVHIEPWLKTELAMEIMEREFKDVNIVKYLSDRED